MHKLGCQRMLPDGQWSHAGVIHFLHIASGLCNKKVGSQDVQHIPYFLAVCD